MTDDTPQEKDVEFYTPRWLMQQIENAMGGMAELDPFAAAEDSSRKTAAWMVRKPNDGFQMDWTFYSGGTKWVWLNPPYRPLPLIASSERFARLRRAALLVPAATSTRYGQTALAGSHYVWFPDKRIVFDRPHGKKSDSPRFNSMLCFRGVTEERLIQAGFQVNGTILKGGLRVRLPSK